MIEGVNSNLSLGRVAGAALSGVSGAGRVGGAGPSGAVDFAETLKSSIDQVARLQQDAAKAVGAARPAGVGSAGGVESAGRAATAVDKSELAFETLLAIRAKLMDAYQEIKGISL
jgi:flagellar hook-basal body complex protein FliE